MELPVIDLERYFGVSQEIGDGGGGSENGAERALQEMCSVVSRTLKETGALLVKDPRCSAEDNDRFLDMMERYFALSDDIKRQQERPHLHYQVISLYFLLLMVERGVTTSYIFSRRFLFRLFPCNFDDRCESSFSLRHMNGSKVKKFPPICP